MKLLIAVDMEGISGVTCWNDVSGEHPEYQRFRRLMTGDVNAAVSGALAGGAESVLVCDGHGSGRNILIEDLHPRAELYSGSPQPIAMLQGVQEADAAFFIGYHAMAGTTPAILDHTWSSSRIHAITLNGKPIGEIGLNAAVCGHFGVPLLLLSGDQSACAEAAALVRGVRGVQVKMAVSRTAARLLPPAIAQERLRQAAEETTRRFLSGITPDIVRVAAPVTLGLEFPTSDLADTCAILPIMHRSGARALEYTADNIVAAVQVFRTMVNLAAGV